MIYDEEKISLMLEHLGFSSVASSSFREDLDPPSVLRRKFSFYMEATK